MARSRFRHPCSAHRFGFAAVAVLAALLLAPGAASGAKFSTATNSSPIVLSRDGKLLWVVNPGGDNVTVINTGNNKVLERIKVGDEPEGVAVDPNNNYAYVANAADGHGDGDPDQQRQPESLQGGRREEPRQERQVPRRAPSRGTSSSSPDGRRVYVANSSQDTITVIDATRARSKRGKPTQPPR